MKKNGKNTIKSKNIWDIKNSMLAHEFTLYMLEHPKFADQLPYNARVVLLPKDDPKLAQFNKKILEKRPTKNQPLVYVHIAKLAPPKSRLIRPRLEVIKNW